MNSSNESLSQALFAEELSPIASLLEKTMPLDTPPIAKEMLFCHFIGSLLKIKRRILDLCHTFRFIFDKFQRLPMKLTFL